MRVGTGDVSPLRFIPAYAGNSLVSAPTEIQNSVHPRLRGELVGLTTNNVISVGSSPLTRGTLTMKDLMAAHKTVHPRLRGELRSCAALRARKTGSSPLTRGTQRNSVRIRLSIWFIPAYAGNSAALEAAAVAAAVHPRLRGELEGGSDPKRP